MGKHEIFDEAFANTWGNRAPREQVQPFYAVAGRQEYGIIFEDDEAVMVNAAFGSSTKLPDKHAESVLDTLVENARRDSADNDCVAVSLNIRASSDDADVLSRVASALVRRAGEYHIAIIDYNFEVVGRRLAVPVDISGTLLSAVPKKYETDVSAPIDRSSLSYVDIDCVADAQALPDSSVDPDFDRIPDYPFAKQSLQTFQDLRIGAQPIVPEDPRSNLTVFNHKNRLIHLSTRSLGAAPAVASFWSVPERAADDVVSLADFAAELQMEPKGLVAFLQFKGRERFLDIESRLRKLADDYGMRNRVVYARAAQKLRGHYQRGPMFFIDGCLICAYDQSKEGQRMKRMLGPQKKDWVYALRGAATPRISGTLELDDMLCELYGPRYAFNKSAALVIDDYFLNPATPLLGLLNGLQRKISSVFLTDPKIGMSHFAKLAAYLKSNDLRVDCSDMFAIPWPEAQLLAYVRRQDGDNWAGWDEMSAYERLNLGTEAVVTSKLNDFEKHVPQNVKVKRLGQIVPSHYDQGGLTLYTADGRRVRLPN